MILALRGSRQSALFYLALSVVLHAALLLTLSGPVGIFNSDRPRTRQEFVQIELVPPSPSRKNKQIAESTLARKSDVAAPDAFLGQQTQRIERQTKARVNAPFRDGKTVSRSRPSGRQGFKGLEVGQLAVPMNLKPLGHLGPNAPLTAEEAATSDFLRDLRPGAQTMLNTKEFAFFSFYQRVRRQLEQFWEPGLRLRLKKMVDRGRQLAADREHSTRLLVVMNPQGAITRVVVHGTSGVYDLDQAAIEAFNRAGPFPNPPKGMVERDGTVKVEWEFVLKT